MLKLLKKVFIGLFVLSLAACGGSNDDNNDDASFSQTITSDTGAVYQCSTEAAANSCTDGSCSDCECTSGCDSSDTDDSNNNDTTTSNACPVDGTNVNVPDNSSCEHGGGTATCVNGTVNWGGITAGGAININGISISCQ